MIDKDSLKTYDKKDLRNKVLELSVLVDDYQIQLGRLNSQVDELNGDRKIFAQRLEETIKDLKHEQDKNKILEANNSRLSEEIRLQTANKSVSATLQGIWSDIKNKIRKKS